MRYYDALRAACSRAGTTQAAMAKRVGIQPVTFQSTKSRGSLPSVERASEFFLAAGYVMCAVPEDSIPKDAIIISSTDEEDPRKARITRLRAEIADLQRQLRKEEGEELLG